MRKMTIPVMGEDGSVCLVESGHDEQEEILGYDITEWSPRFKLGLATCWLHYFGWCQSSLHGVKVERKIILQKEV